MCSAVLCAMLKSVIVDDVARGATAILGLEAFCRSDNRLENGTLQLRVR